MTDTARYMTCTRCGMRINVSKFCTVPENRYLCPWCRRMNKKMKKEESKP